MDLVGIVRSIVGRKHRISRDEAARILEAAKDAGLSLENDCVTDCSPTAWAGMVKGIKCVSISAGDHGEPLRWHGFVRFDDPGSMAPNHRADIMLVPDGLLSVEYLRRKCKRLLIVS